MKPFGATANVPGPPAMPASFIHKNSIKSNKFYFEVKFELEGNRLEEASDRMIIFFSSLGALISSRPPCFANLCQ